MWAGIIPRRTLSKRSRSCVTRTPPVSDPTLSALQKSLPLSRIPHTVSLVNRHDPTVTGTYKKKRDLIPAWHAEWDTLRSFARRTLVAGSQCGELLAGLQVNTGRMAETLGSADVFGEQRAIADPAGQ